MTGLVKPVCDAYTGVFQFCSERAKPDASSSTGCLVLFSTSLCLPQLQVNLSICPVFYLYLLSRNARGVIFISRWNVRVKCALSENPAAIAICVMDWSEVRRSSHAWRMR